MNLCAEIQSAADTGNSRGMFEGIKKAIGPTQSKSSPLKTSTGEIITDKSRLIGNEMPVNEMPEMTFDNEMGDGAVPDENHQIINGVLRVTGGKDHVL